MLAKFWSFQPRRRSFTSSGPSLGPTGPPPRELDPRVIELVVHAAQLGRAYADADGSARREASRRAARGSVSARHARRAGDTHTRAHTHTHAPRRRRGARFWIGGGSLFALGEPALCAPRAKFSARCVIPAACLPKHTHPGPPTPRHASSPSDRKYSACERGGGSAIMSSRSLGAKSK